MDTLIHGYKRGNFTLPDELVEAARAVEPIRAALDEQPQDGVAEAKAKFEASVLEAARAGEKLPSGIELVKAKVNAEVQSEATAILQEELRQAERRLRATLRGVQEAILLNLRAALEETMDGAAKAKGDDLARRAERYSAIRSGRGELRKLPTPSRDTHGLFAEFENTDALWPEFYPERSRAQVQNSIQVSVAKLREQQENPLQFTPAPWPGGQLERFKWIVAHAEPWLPTAAEQDVRFERYLKERKTDLAARQREWHDKHIAVA